MSSQLKTTPESSRSQGWTSAGDPSKTRPVAQRTVYKASSVAYSSQSGSSGEQKNAATQ